jgi:hypothetical protein
MEPTLGEEVVRKDFFMDKGTRGRREQGIVGTGIAF